MAEVKNTIYTNKRIIPAEKIGDTIRPKEERPMEKKNNKTSISNEEITVALLSNNTIKDAAAAAGISERTIYDRMTKRDFKVVYNAAKADIIRQAVYSINIKLISAINTVSDIMENEEIAPATRLQAAQTIINNAEKFSSRLTGIEREMEAYTRDPYDFGY